jgi:hypothetical protein
VCAAEEVPSPRFADSPTMWPAVFSAGGWRALASGPAVSCSHEGRSLLRPGSICLPPPSSGRLGEFDGGRFLDGAGEVLSPVLPVQQGACCSFFLAGSGVGSSGSRASTRRRANAVKQTRSCKDLSASR